MTGHHVEALSAEGKKQYEAARVEHEKKSPKKKKYKAGKGGGKGGRFNVLADGEADEEEEDEDEGEASEEEDEATDQQAGRALKIMAKLLPMTDGEKVTKKTYVYNEALQEMEEFELVDREDDERDDKQDPMWSLTRKEIDEAYAAHDDHRREWKKLFDYAQHDTIEEGMSEHDGELPRSLRAGART